MKLIHEVSITTYITTFSILERIDVGETAGGRESARDAG